MIGSGRPFFIKYYLNHECPGNKLNLPQIDHFLITVSLFKLKKAKHLFVLKGMQTHFANPKSLVMNLTFTFT